MGLFSWWYMENFEIGFRARLPHWDHNDGCGVMRFAYMDVGEGREQDREASLVGAFLLDEQRYHQ